jgi:hypothetical protein
MDYTGIIESDLGFLPDCVELLVAMRDQIRDPFLPGYSWESRECYSIGVGSLSFTGRPQTSDPVVKILIRLDLVDLMASTVEDHNCLRFFPRHKKRVDKFIEIYTNEN